MNAYLSLGRWFFAIPFAVVGLFHLMDAEAMAAIVPNYMPAKTIFVYLAGAGLIAATISMVIGKFDKLAAVLLSLYLIILVVMVHAPTAMANGPSSQMAKMMLMKDLSLAGAAMLYAAFLAKDRSVIG